MMKQLTMVFYMMIFLLSSACSKENLQSDKATESIQTDSVLEIEVMDDYVIASNGDLQITVGDQTISLEINALADSQIIEDDQQRLLILSDPTDQYQHGILGDELEARSVTIVQLSNQPEVISHFSVPEDWVIESILPIWSDWDGDGIREIVLTLSNSTSGAKLVLYDEKGNVLAESLPIGKGFRWRHTLAIDGFGEDGQKLLVDVQTPHIGGIVTFYRWDKDEKLLSIEASLTGYSTHDIGSRTMHMYALDLDEANDQVILVIPNQSKTEVAGLRLVSGVIIEEWRMPLGGTLSGDLELMDDGDMIRAIVDNNREVLLSLPK